MISTDQTRWIIRKLDAQAAVAAAAQAVVDEASRRLEAQQSYTITELRELISLANEEYDYDLASELCSWALWKDASHDYVEVGGWGPSRLVKRPAHVPFQVRMITRCTCDGGTCCYCTCCELWNGEHSCEWDRDRRRGVNRYRNNDIDRSDMTSLSLDEL